MRKIILSAIVALMTGAAIVNAGQRQVGLPQGPSGDLATYDYGGVSIATITFSSANCQLFQGEGVVYGFVATSNTALTDAISFRSSTGILTGFQDAGRVGDGDYTTTNEVLRVHLSSYPSVIGNVVNFSGQLGMQYKFLAPARFKNGAAAKANVGTIGLITYFYHKFSNKVTENGTNELP